MLLFSISMPKLKHEVLRCGRWLGRSSSTCVYFFILGRLIYGMTVDLVERIDMGLLIGSEPCVLGE